jgi:hypothetical protein
MKAAGLTSTTQRRRMAFAGIVTAFRVCDPSGGPVAKRMKKISYDGYRFPPEIIQ